MKVAILLSGHIREFKNISFFIDNLSQMMSVDTYIHTWMKRDMDIYTWRQPEFSNVNNLDRNSIINTFKPNGLLIEDQSCVDLFEFYKRDIDCTKPDFSGAHFMIYGMHKVYELFKFESEKKGLMYDAVIRLRFDLKIENINSFVKDLSKLSENNCKVLMLSHNWASALGAYFDGLILATVKDYSSIMSALPHYFELNYQIINDRVRYIPELIISECILRNDIEIEDCSFQLSLVRKNEIIEQTFSGKLSFITILRSNAQALNLSLYSFGIDFFDNYITRSWINKNGLLKICCFTIFYTPILLFKSIKKTLIKDVER